MPLPGQTPEIASPPASAVTEGSAPPQDDLEHTAAPGGSAPDDTETSPAGTRESVPAKTRIEVSPDTIEDLKAQRKRRQKAEQEAAYWRGVAEAQGRGFEALSRSQGQDTPSSVQDQGPPQPAQFTTYAEYEHAREEYLLQRAEERVEQRREEERRHAAAAAIESRFQENLQAAAELDPEIEDIYRDKTLPVSPAMARVIKSSERAPELLRYLHENRKEARAIFDCRDPLEAAARVGRIEARLEAKAAAAPPIKKVTGAPPPIQTVGNRGTGEVEPDKLTTEQWMEKRNASLSKRRRR